MVWCGVVWCGVVWCGVWCVVRSGDVDWWMLRLQATSLSTLECFALPCRLYPYCTYLRHLLSLC